LTGFYLEMLWKKYLRLQTETKPYKKIDEYSKFWMAIPGTRGAVGKKTVNASTHFNALFDVEEPEVEEEHEDGCFTEAEEHKLEELEDEQLRV